MFLPLVLSTNITRFYLSLTCTIFSLLKNDWVFQVPIHFYFQSTPTPTFLLFPVCHARSYLRAVLSNLIRVCNKSTYVRALSPENVFPVPPVYARLCFCSFQICNVGLIFYESLSVIFIMKVGWEVLQNLVQIRIIVESHRVMKLLLRVIT